MYKNILLNIIEVQYNGNTNICQVNISVTFTKTEQVEHRIEAKVVSNIQLK